MKTFREHLEESNLRYIVFSNNEKLYIKDALREFRHSDMYDYKNDNFKQDVDTLIDHIKQDMAMEQEWAYAGTLKEMALIEAALYHYYDFLSNAKNKINYNKVGELINKIKTQYKTKDNENL